MDPELTKKINYLIEINNNTGNLDGLAMYYFNQGQRAKAFQTWQKNWEENKRYRIGENSDNAYYWRERSK